MNVHHYPIEHKQFPPSESELLLASTEREWKNFVVLPLHLPAMDDFASEPAILTSVDRIVLHLSGTGLLEHRFNGQTYRGKPFPGSFCILPRGNPSAWHLNHPATVLYFYLFPSLIAPIASDICHIGSDCLELGYLFNDYDPLIEQIGRTILSELQIGAAPSHLYIESLVQTLAIHLVQNYSSIPSTLTFLNGTLAPHQLRRVKAYIQERLSENLSLTELAGVVGSSARHFSRQFKQATGFSPHQYLIHSRLERAKVLLHEGRLPIAEIAQQTGFADQSHLTHHYRRVFDVTPGMRLQNGKNIQKDGKIVQEDIG